jgi:thiol:disulfide interchange protein DsbC
MKKTIIVALVTSLFASLSFAAAPSADKIKKAFPILAEFNVNITDSLEDESFYVYKSLIQTQQGVRPAQFYVTKDLKRIIFGDAFDKDGKKISIASDLTKIEKDAAWKWGTGKDKYYVFTDPECPYCQRMQKRFSDPKSGTYYFFLYPLSFHANAKDMSAYILEQETKKKGAGHEAALLIAESGDYKTALSKIDPKKRAEYAAKIDANIKLGDSLGVSGTPSVFNAKGESVDWTKVIK